MNRPPKYLEHISLPLSLGLASVMLVALIYALHLQTASSPAGVSPFATAWLALSLLLLLLSLKFRFLLFHLTAQLLSFFAFFNIFAGWI